MLEQAFTAGLQTSSLESGCPLSCSPSEHSSRKRSDFKVRRQLKMYCTYALWQAASVNCSPVRFDFILVDLVDWTRFPYKKVQMSQTWHNSGFSRCTAKGSKSTVSAITCKQMNSCYYLSEQFVNICVLIPRAQKHNAFRSEWCGHRGFCARIFMQCYVVNYGVL